MPIELARLIINNPTDYAAEGAVGFPFRFRARGAVSGREKGPVTSAIIESERWPRYGIRPPINPLPGRPSRGSEPKWRLPRIFRSVALFLTPFPALSRPGLKIGTPGARCCTCFMNRSKLRYISLKCTGIDVR